MEIGEKCVDYLKLEARIDKNIIFATGLAGFGIIFQSASDRSTESNYSVACIFCAVNFSYGILRNIEPFRMHVMVFYVIAADGQESAQANMQCEIFNDYAFVA